VRTVLIRFRNRAQLTQRDIEQAARQVTVTTNDAPTESEQQREERTNRNPARPIIVRVTESRYVPSVATSCNACSARRHNTVVDFEITVPECSSARSSAPRRSSTSWLGAIASISLVVGGIGIMNIMLASVLERIREIGCAAQWAPPRRTSSFQFLSEAVLISVAGGVVGILVGVGLSMGIERFAGITTSCHPVRVRRLRVSFTVGIAFGIVPAYRAARQDPVVCLRYE